VRERIARTVIAARCPPPRIGEPTLQSRLQTGHALFIEISLEVLEGEDDGRDAGRDRLMRQASEMLAMLYESARQAYELKRVLIVVGESTADIEPRRLAAPDDHAGLLGTNTTALRQQAERASDLTADVVGQMQTLLLQLTQLGTRAIDLVRAAEFTREARDALDLMQAEVAMRHAVAEELIAELSEPSYSERI
jgi:hypothetical protein